MRSEDAALTMELVPLQGKTRDVASLSLSSTRGHREESAVHAPGSGSWSGAEPASTSLRDFPADTWQCEPQAPAVPPSATVSRSPGPPHYRPRQAPRGPSHCDVSGAPCYTGKVRARGGIAARTLGRGFDSGFSFSVKLASSSRVGGARLGTPRPPGARHPLAPPFVTGQALGSMQQCRRVGASTNRGRGPQSSGR